MRILYHHRTQAEDGQAVHIRAMIEAFRGLGHEVREVGLVKRSENGKNAERFGWIARLPRFAHELAEYGYSGVARAALLRAAAQAHPDFVYERYAFGNAAGMLAARKLAIPLVLEVNSPMVLELGRTRGLSFPGLAQRIEDRVFRSATLVCAVTGVLRDMLLERGVAPERVLVTPNGVVLERFECADRARAASAARQALGLGERQGGELVLGFVGYYRPWHRLDVVLDALRSSALARARLVLIGEGPARAELEARARQNGVLERVHFSGARPHAEIPSLLCAFDVALVPAINPYASPLKLFEYMAASLAIVAPDQPNLREVLEPGADALLVPAGDAAAMESALVRLAGDPDLRATLGANARAKLERLDLSWSANARRVIEALERRR